MSCSARHGLPVLLTALGVLLAPSSAHAQCDDASTTWIGNTGSMLDPANWSGGEVPGPDATLVFDAFTPVSPNLTRAELTVARIVLRGGSVSLGLDDGLLDAQMAGPTCPSLAIGGPGPAQLLVPFGIPDRSVLSVASAEIGTIDGPGRLVVDSIPSWPELRVGTDLVVGGDADGLLRRLNLVSADRLIIGRDAPGRVELVPDLQIAGELIVGDRSFGTLLDANVTAGELIIGSRQGSLGEVTVDASRSMTIAQSVAVGARGFGVLDVAGQMTVGGDLRLGVFATNGQPGYFDRGSGLVFVRGAGTVLDVSGDLALGLLGHADLDIAAPARIIVGGSITTGNDGFAEDTDRRVTLQLGAPGNGDPLLLATGPIDMPALEVRFASGYGPAAGDSWTLIESAAALNFAVGTPPTFALLPAGLSWSIVNDGQRLVASIIETPIPSADIDGDGTVGLDDLLLVLAAFGPCPEGAPCPADINGSGHVDFLDLVQVLAAWS